MSANIIISNDSMNNSSRILASKSNENGLSTIFSYNGNDITFKTENGITYVNATEMAKPFKKRPNDYLSLSSVNELINAITRKYGNADFQPVTIIRGTVSPGTWMCEDLALDFAQWLSVDFRLWCLDRIKEFLTTGKCVIPDFNDPPAAAEAWAKEYRGRVAAEKLALEERAKAEEMAKVLESKKEDIKFSESFIMSGESDLLVRDLAKKLEQNDIIISDKCLRDFLVKIKIIVKRIKVNGDWEITANAVKKGFAHYRDKNICTESGKVVYARTIYITGKGYRYILSSINGSKKSDFILCGGMFRDYGVFAGSESFNHWDN